MNQLTRWRGQYEIPNILLNIVEFAIELNIEHEKEMRKVFEPGVYMKCCESVRDYLEGTVKEHTFPSRRRFKKF